MSAKEDEQERLETVMTEALGRASDVQLDEVAELLLAQSRTVRMMALNDARGRMRLAEQLTALRQRCDMLWLAMLGMGLKMVATPEGAAKAVGYVVETGEPVLGTMEVRPLPKTPSDREAE